MMASAIDMIGFRVGRLTVVAPSELRAGNEPGQHWRCKCDCGGERASVSTRMLRRKDSPAASCGCIAPGPVPDPSKAVKPCAKCGDPKGYAFAGRRIPARFRGVRFGYKDDICHACYQWGVKELKENRILAWKSAREEPVIKEIDGLTIPQRALCVKWGYAMNPEGYAACLEAVAESERTHRPVRRGEFACSKSMCGGKHGIPRYDANHVKSSVRTEKSCFMRRINHGGA